MTDTLWGGPESLAGWLDAVTAADDRQIDRRLLPWDVLGTMGHVEGLAAAGLLSERERAKLQRALRSALRAWRAGEFTVTDADEDAHTALERRLVASCGELGEKVHAGRSRNDQVMAALRLLLKDRLLAVSALVLDASAELAAFGRRHRGVLLPGYTHLRRAMPSTVGLWAGSFAEALLDDLGPLRAALDLVDRSPLGSAAGYGVPLPLDRRVPARALGFAAVQGNVVAVQSSRGKLEATVLAALWPVAYDLAKLSWDVILFSSEEYGFLALPKELATGSSIMPHKKNPDLFELTRGRLGVVEGCLHEAMAVAGGLPSGYHRDLQLTKGPVLRGLDAAERMLAVAIAAVPRLAVDRARCRAAVAGDLLATDEVFRRVRAGRRFRAAYREVAGELREGKTLPRPRDREILAARGHEGGAGAPGLAGVGREISLRRRALSQRRANHRRALAGLAGGEAMLP